MYNLYDMIFKRKSFRRFDDSLSLSSEELQKIQQHLKILVPLLDDVKIKYRIVKRQETSCKRGEYCLLVYSEEKENCLINIGYTLEQLDLWLASQNIGVCWYGVGKTDKLQYDGLDYVIMLAFGKARPEEFRKDYTKAKRKELEIIWSGEHITNVTNVVGFAPSACNSQPWRVVHENQLIRIFRSTEVKSIFPKERLLLYNCIDMGIFLYFMELALRQEQYRFERILSEKESSNEKEIEIAQYNVYKV
ncbi:nitroreductase family protein [Alkaliphilus peptidifermentans]|uniref:Putative TM nitroreductase n=1 Tax=Alkaliphilus peptidifermentans DSM 18978 TaxID=1120976 RepID=A0A1G5H9N9_9FIRM|nr:nitroreductase family protein [Alkaliphilus peptidifermentans]SCY60605.1 Putative TM nitroreductase [Alkaliphilus peptidifermentans DSM 18978]